MQVSGDGGSWIDPSNYIKASEDRVASGGGGGGGGAIEFDADGIQKVIDQILDIIDFELVKSKRDAGTILRDLPENVDPVSLTYVRSVNKFADGYEAWSDDFIDRLRAYVKKLEKVKKTMLEREEEVSSEMNRVLS